jgi:serine/threonine-protein kinase
MAPELLKMVDPGPKSDLYSCAVVLHELLTGKNEFYSKDVASTAWSVLEHVPTPVDKARPDVPPGLTDVLKKALSKAPEDRHADALQFAQELRRIRGMAADDAARMLSEAASRDYNNPEMASSLKATDLATLDRKWREPGRKFSFRPSLKSIRVRRSDPAQTMPPTKVTAAEATLTAQRRWGRKGIVIGATVVVLGAGAATVVAMRRGATESQPPGVILIEGSVAAVGVAAQPVGASDPGAIVPAKAADAPPANAEPSARPPPPTPTKPASPKSRSELLTRAFARQQPQIARCFSQHASDVTGSPEISVRFEVGTDGHVISAQVQPAALGTTPLGQCIAAVARATEFGPQPDPTTFRIPITAKRGQ